MKKALERMPTTIDDAFGVMLQRIETSLDPDSATTALRTLTWVYYARRPMVIAELREAVLIEDGDRDVREDIINDLTIMDCCLSFITYDHGTVRFIHPSVQRWLKEEPQNGKLLSECYLAKTCLTFLNFDLFDEQFYYYGAYDDFRRTYSERYIFGHYAWLFWDDHTRNVEDKVEVQEVALLFLQSKKKRETMLGMEMDFGKWRSWPGPPFPNFSHKPFQTILPLVAERGFATLCAVLLKDRDERYLILTCIINASVSDRPTSVLGDYSQDVNSKDNWDKDRAIALHWAAVNGYEKTVAALLTAKANVNMQDSCGMTALNWAVRSGREKIVAQLLGANAAVNIKDKEGDTVLHWAAFDGDPKIFELLLNATSDVNAQDSSGFTALDLAAFGGHMALVELLLNAKAEVNVRDNDGRTALGLVPRSHRNERLLALLKANSAHGKVEAIED
jgi:Ankyrin repeats (3 copies)/Ankyrin repeat